jgi:RimJ/RimL family protein N-acetyltransferase
VGGVVGLRPVGPGDLDVYLRMRTDAAMMAHLGGPQDAAGMAAKVHRDVEAAAADREWILMILPGDDPAAVAGTVALWQHEAAGETISEIGWMVLPEHQGKGIATDALRTVLRRAAADGRWGPIHAYPAVTNMASNRLCRRLGFTSTGARDIIFRNRLFRTNRWVWTAPKPLLGTDVGTSKSSAP